MKTLSLSFSFVGFGASALIRSFAMVAVSGRAEEADSPRQDERRVIPPAQGPYALGDGFEQTLQAAYSRWESSNKIGRFIFRPPANCMGFDTAFPAIPTAHISSSPLANRTESRPSSFPGFQLAGLPRNEEFAQDAIEQLDGKGKADGTHHTVDAAISNLLARGVIPILRPSS
ncbi:hypothetical protein CMUS01_11287 [Colletotrichum musicola]|uniref:Uncharacterized protein n=1 Tax=Colletotrichum musicola TaxID=2175873 RepID=A0A8H6N761_9PEZI|nr:hypothetical protein CMUS01_11287 [Colletotrichum musicola]